MTNLTNMITIILILSTANEQLIERLLGQWKNPIIDKMLIYISLLLGIVEAVAFRINGMAQIGLDVPPLAGMIATGLLIGSGSGAIHKFFGNIGVGSSGK